MFKQVVRRLTQTITRMAARHAARGIVRQGATTIPMVVLRVAHQRAPGIVGITNATTQRLRLIVLSTVEPAATVAIRSALLRKQPARVQWIAVQEQAVAVVRQIFIAATPRLRELVTGHTVRTDARGLAVARADARRVLPLLVLRRVITRVPVVIPAITPHVRAGVRGTALVVRADALRRQHHHATPMVSAMLAKRCQAVRQIVAARQPHPVHRPLQTAILRAWPVITPTVRMDAHGVEAAPADV